MPDRRNMRVHRKGQERILHTNKKIHLAEQVVEHDWQSPPFGVSAGRGHASFLAVCSTAVQLELRSRLQQVNHLQAGDFFAQMLTQQCVAQGEEMKFRREDFVPVVWQSWLSGWVVAHSFSHVNALKAASFIPTWRDTSETRMWMHSNKILKVS